MKRAAPTVVLAAVLASAAPAHAAPEDDGTLGVTKTTVQVPVAAGVALATDIYVPQAAGPFPTVVIRHGFARSKANFVNWGNHLASRGFVTLVPTSRSPFSPNPPVDAADILAVLGWAVAQSATSGAPLEGKVDAARRGIAGHSAGGLAATLAAASDATLRGAVLFDEVDDSPTNHGVAAAPGIAVPTISLFAEPGTCNAMSNGVTIFNAITAPKLAIKVTDSQHCDPEDPSDSLCGTACGGNAQAQYQLLYRRYGTAFLEAFLKCDPAAYPYVNGAAAQADPGISIYPATDIVVPPPGCADDDAGVPPADAAPAAAPAPPDAVDYPDGAPPRDDAGNPVADDGGTGGGSRGGCGCRTASTPPTLAALLLAAVLLPRPRRRR